MGGPDGAMGLILTYGNKEYIPPLPGIDHGVPLGEGHSVHPWTPQPP